MRSWHIVGALALALVGSTGALQTAPAGASDDVKAHLKRLEASSPGWLPTLDKCPADVIPARDVPSNYSPGRCATTLQRCLRDCRAGNASECYHSALVLQKVRNNPISEALFLRSCTLGITSGCTNRAAAMKQGTSCAIRTFGKACDRNDPWACTMLGMHLVRGVGIAKDRKRARRVLSRACRYGASDPACRSARRLLKEAGR